MENIDKTSRFLREDGVYATPQYESDLPLKVIGGEINMLSNAKPLFLDETGKSINASLQKIASAIKSGGGGGGGGGDVPTKLSELENDVGFITNSANNLTNYYNKTQADSLLEGKVSTEPGKSLSTNDYTTEDKNKLRDLTQVTESTVSDWGFTKNTGTYSKPSGGIPKSDLANNVQESLGKADTALQSHQDISGKADKVANATSGHLAALDLEGNLTDSGSKPSDFASATEQTELKENLSQLSATISDAWDNTKTYSVGDYCIYQNQLYKCITQCQGVLPTDTSYFVQTSVSKEFINITNTTMITLNNSVDIPVSTLIKTIIISRGADHVGTVYLCDYWNIYKIAGTDIVQTSKQGNIVTITNNNPQYGSIFVRVI